MMAHPWAVAVLIVVSWHFLGIWTGSWLNPQTDAEMAVHHSPLILVHFFIMNAYPFVYRHYKALQGGLV